MLAQNFKTPTDLGITDAEFNALFKVLGMLERGELEHMRADVFDPGPLGGHTPQFFNMCLVESQNDCGTACCIMGWARFIAHDRSLFHSRTLAASDLFRISHTDGTIFIYPGKFSSDILPSDAAIALRNYLTHGEPRWAEALQP